MVIRLLKTIIFTGLLCNLLLADAYLDVKAVNKIAAEIVQDSNTVKELTKQLQQLHTQVAKDEKAIATQSDVLANVIHYLRHFRYYSASMVMLSASKPEDVVHLQLLLESVVPQVQLQQAGLKAVLKKLQETYEEIDRQHHKVKMLEINNQRRITDLLALVTVENAGVRQNIISLNTCAFHQVEAAIEPFLEQAKQVEETSKIHPKLMMPCHADVTKEGQQFVFTNNANQIVLAPMDATVLFATHVSGQNIFMFLGQGAQHLSIAGLDYSVVNKGQRVRRGEILGIVTADEATVKKLTVKYYFQGRSVNENLWEERL